jgi:hypothetical protein
VAVLKEKGLKENQIDGIKRYLEMRYISTIEACWRLFQFDTPWLRDWISILRMSSKLFSLIP